MSATRIALAVSSLKEGTPYRAYSYSYPHKTAYRPLAPARNLGEAWANEPKDSLFLYIHIPFCEMRCGFCNLFTTANSSEDRVDSYLRVLERQCAIAADSIRPAGFARSAIGGGTPTYLSPHQLDRLFDMIARHFSVDPARIPISVETSPRTADHDRLLVLKRRGVSRISIGVQSMIDAEVNSAGRAQKVRWVCDAVERIRALEFATLNVDLIYGLPEQTTASWRESLNRTLKFKPEEIYLYPLYVRPLTGLDRWGEHPQNAVRLNCYREARDILLAAGYQQLSMRMFRAPWAPEQDGPVYCCQDDGMAGMGCGARSYTRSLHYSNEYAVGASGVNAILRRYLENTDERLAQIDYGCYLDLDEQKRRYIIKSLLRATGLDSRAYFTRFGSEASTDVPQVADLAEQGFIIATDKGKLHLTEIGMERSDAIGPYLYSSRVRQMMDEYEFQ